MVMLILLQLLTHKIFHVMGLHVVGTPAQLSFRSSSANNESKVNVVKYPI